MKIILFLGLGVKKEYFKKKKIYNYLNKLGDLKLIDMKNDINFDLSIKKNLEKLNINDKYLVLGHSIGAYFVYGMNKYFPNNIIKSFIFDGSIFNKQFIDDSNDELFTKLYNEIGSIKSKNKIVFIRNIDDNYDELDKKYFLDEINKLSKKKSINFVSYIIKNKGHNFYMNDSNFEFIKQIIEKEI